MRRNSIRLAGVAMAIIVGIFAAGAYAANPTVSGLTADQPVTASAPALRWHAFKRATGYRIVRDGDVLATVRQTHFTDTKLSDNGVHTYAVRAVRGRNLISRAAHVTVTYDTRPPEAITDPLGGDHLTDGAPEITWPHVDDVGPSGIKQYNIRRDDVYIASVPAGQLSFTDTSVGSGTYSYTVRAEDNAGNKADEYSPPEQITVDLSHPGTPTGLQASNTDGVVTLTWDAAPDPSAIAGYQVLRDGQQIATTSDTTASDTPPAGSHDYTVVAVDAAGNTSDPSDPASVTIDGGTPPPPPPDSTYTGVSVETGNDQSIGMKNKWTDAKIISLTLHWDQLEPSRGVYNWGNLDASLRDAAARHYKVIVRILCGFNAPVWIYNDPQNPVQHAYLIPTDDGYGLRTGVDVPVPWDPNLLVHYKQMMQALGDHLGAADGQGGTLGSNVYMIPVSMATAFGSEMVENFGQGTWSGTYNGVTKSGWDRRSVNQNVWLGLAPSGSTDADRLASMQNADTQAWLDSVDAQESILAPTGIPSSVAYGYAFNSFGTATTVASTEVPKYKDMLYTMFTSLQPKVSPDGSLGPWGAWCPSCDSLVRGAIADGGPIGFQIAGASGMMSTPAHIEYATNSAIASYHPQFIETVGTIIDKDYGYFFTDNQNVQRRLDTTG
jgi:hypothetical protein